MEFHDGDMKVVLRGSSKDFRELPAYSHSVANLLQSWRNPYGSPQQLGRVQEVASTNPGSGFQTQEAHLLPSGSGFQGYQRALPPASGRYEQNPYREDLPTSSAPTSRPSSAPEATPEVTGSNRKPPSRTSRRQLSRFAWMAIQIGGFCVSFALVIWLARWMGQPSPSPQASPAAPPKTQPQQSKPAAAPAKAASPNPAPTGVPEEWLK